MPMGCLQNLNPTDSTQHALGSCISPEIKLLIQTLKPTPEPNTSVFKTIDAPIEFIYCLSGGVKIFATDNKGKSFYTQIHEGCGAVLHLPLCNGYSIAKPNCPLQLIALQITPKNLKRLAKATGCPLELQAKRIFQGTRRPSLLQETPLPLPIRLTLQQMLTCPLSNEISKLFLEYKKMELIYQQLSLLSSDLLTARCNKRHHMHQAHHARKILLDNMVNPPSLQDLSTKVGMNKSQLNRTFKAVFGDTVFGILRIERLKCAQKMLEDSTNSVTEVAYECGFSSPSHLTKAFKQYFGIRPKQYQTSVLCQQLGTPL